jgi:hypothetical protein
MKEAADAVGDGGAIIVSSDPFFTLRRNRIIRLGIKSGRIMCYPLKEYFDDADGEAPKGSFFSYGPSLAEVYKQIGTDAVNILSGVSAPPFTIMPATLTYSPG